MDAVVYQPDFLYSNGQLTRGTLVVSEDGSVLEKAPPDATTVRLDGQLLLPGLVNAHSHAFQRVLRGRTHFVPKGREADDFWSWRELMYRAASTLDPEGIFIASRQAFIEMALSGITAVGEFHYLHNQPDGTPYPDEQELAWAVIHAAREAGLRIALLRVAYARAGFNVAPNPRQARFIEPDAATFLGRAEDLARKIGDSKITIGLAPHSVRAVPRDWLIEIAAHANGRVVHIHVAEQPAEIAACLAEHNLRPVQLLDSTGLLGKRTTGVHAIHLDAADVETLARTGTSVCACPSTERDLGDGVIPADQLLRAGVPLSLGSDSQAIIDLLDDARQLEGHLRLLRLKRAVLDPGDGSTGGTAKRLLDIATAGGARSLGLDTGTLAPGTPADFCTIELDTPALAGVTEDALLAAVVFAPAKIQDVYVQGKRIVRDGRHPRAEASSKDFSALMKNLVTA